MKNLIEIREKLYNFENLKFKHPIFDSFYEKLKTTILYRSMDSEQVIIGFGPTGIGKTTLLGILTQDILPDFYTILGDDDPERHSYLPIAYSPMIVPERGVFNWRVNFLMALSKIGAIRPEKVISFDKSTDLQKMSINRNATIADLREAFISYLKNRKVQVFIFDEAQHMGIGCSGSQISRQLDVIKGIADETGTLFLLMGTYDILDVCGYNSQLRRRGVEMYFPPYMSHNPDNISTFRNIVYNFETFFTEIETGIDPPGIDRSKKALEQVFYRCCGCIGLLKRMYYMAYRHALINGLKKISTEFLINQTISENLTADIHMDIIHGEKRMKPQTFVAQASESKNTTTNTSPKRNLPPGTRNPSITRIADPEEVYNQNDSRG